MPELKDGGAVRIRRLRESDGEKLYELFRHISRPSRVFFAPYEFTRAQAEAVAAKARATSFYCVVAERTSLLGYAWFDGEGEYPAVGIAVADECRSLGVGPLLLRALIEEAARRGHKGLFLTVIENNLRALRLYSRLGFRLCGECAMPAQLCMRLRFDEQRPAFPRRGTYAHSIPWHLGKMTTDTWTLDDWKWYLKLLQAAGCNLLKIYIWPNQFHLPGQPETEKNRWRYEVYREALRYARALGMEAYVAFSNNTAPPHVWLAHPELRATEVGYRGITLCWNRGKHQIVPYQKYIIDYFADVADGFIVWFADPGLCVCERCRDQGRVVADSLETYATYLGSRGRLTACLWWFEVMEEGKWGFKRHPGLRVRTLRALEGAPFVIVDERERKTRAMARRAGFDVLRFAFFLDPEGGTEKCNCLPYPKFDRIGAAVEESLRAKDAGLIAYRLTPYVQFASDWLFHRKQIKPGISAYDALVELGTVLKLDPPADFAHALLEIDGWWSARGDLGRAIRLLEPLGGAHDLALRSLEGSTRILKLLAEGKDKPVDGLVTEVQETMLPMPVFQGFTLEQLWLASRSRAFLEQRVRWWLDYIEAERGRKR